MDDGNGCSNSCLLNDICGDGIVQALIEACDDGNVINGDGCDNNCTVTACGNEIITGGELCDDGTENGDGEGFCLPDCSGIQACGNGVANGTEGCDDGNMTPCDGCSSDCGTVENHVVPVCGTGDTCGMEACDDGSESPTCDADCTIAECGDGTINTTASEDCDDGNNMDDGNGCDENCLRNDVCGDGIVQSLFEVCDTVGNVGCNDMNFPTCDIYCDKCVP